MIDSSRRSKWGFLRWLPGVLISALAIYLVFRKTTWADLISSFNQIKPGIILLAIGFFMVTTASRAFAWRALLKNKVSFVKTFLIMNEGYLLNNTLPFRLGELGRAVIMGKVSGLGTFHVISTIIMERIFDIVISAALLLLGIVFVAKSVTLSFIAWIVLGIIILLFFTLWILSKNKERIQAWIDKKSESSRFFQRFVQKYSKNFLEGLGFMHEPRFFLPAFGLMLLSWSGALAEYFILLKSFIPVATIWWAALALGTVAFGVAIPSAPASVGVFEGALVLALVPLAGEPQKGLILAYALVIHILHFILNGIFGLIGFLVQGESISDIWKGITLQKPAGAEKME